LRPPVITLTTDFGTADYYVGAMKGVLLTIAPNAVLVDLSHQIPPQDVRAGYRVLRDTAGEFPPGTVHLAVVDPGVGGDRRPLAVRALSHYWVGPDNGLLSHALKQEQAEVRQLCHPGIARPEIGSTFHGRDLFAPFAAHLAGAFPFVEVGPEVTDPVILTQTPAHQTSTGWAGEIEHVDTFGNLITNIPAEVLSPVGRPLLIRPGTQAAIAGLSSTYGDVAAGELVALIGSTGTLEIAVCDGSAASALGLGPGAPVTIDPA